jgi:hypothetical protein
LGAQLQQLNFIVSFGTWLGLEFFLEKNYCSRSDIDFVENLGLDNIFDIRRNDSDKNIWHINITDEIFLKDLTDMIDEKELKKNFVNYNYSGK